MAFNFDEAVKQAAKSLSPKNLMCIVLGPSGGGKSSLCGTLPGKTLMIYFRGERHGAANANALGGDINPLIVDIDNGVDLNPDEAYTRLLDIIAAPELARFDSIVLDGIPELESILIRTKKFEQGCTNDKGKHNSFAESRVLLTLFKPVLEAFNRFYTAGKNVVATCKIDVRSLDGQTAGIEECIPKMLTYSVADEIISKFPDIIVVGKVTNGTDWKHMLQFHSAVTRTSKDENKQVKKFINFSPRLSGVLEYPEFMEANFKKVIELKTAKKEIK